MQLDATEMEKLANAIAPILVSRLKATTRILVGIRDIERMCGFAKDSSAVRDWISDPTFPTPCGAARSRRWFLADVIGWLKGKQIATSELTLDVALM